MLSPVDPSVILHIGGSKCGSSAIQAYLARNVEALRARGLGVPGVDLDFTSKVTGEQIWFFENAATSGQHSLVAQRVQSLITAAREAKMSRLVISAENLCNHAGLAPVLAEVLGGLDASIVFYVRRQDDFLISSWQQWNLKRFPSVEAFLEARAGKDACWYSMLVPWAEQFGDDRVTVRPFVRDRLKDGDVIADFCCVARIGQEGLEPLERDANPSFDEALARLAHRVRDVFDGPHDNRFYEVMARLLGEAALRKGSGSSLLDLETRQRVLRLYDDENRALKARFLKEEPSGPLFALPRPESVVQRSEAEKTSEDIAMLTRAVYALATRLEGGNV